MTHATFGCSTPSICVCAGTNGGWDLEVLKVVEGGDVVDVERC